MASEITPNAEFDPVYAEAADWFARLHDAEITVEEAMEWQRLMAQRPEFAAAYARLEEIWNAVDDIEPPAASPKRGERFDRYDGSLPVSSWLNRHYAGAPRRPAFLLAASVAALAAGLTWLIVATNRSVEVVQTPGGQNQAFILADGSRVNLGANTRIEVSLGAHDRHLNLVRGEAFFAVAKDAKRPFTVQSGDASVTAVGTEFSVNRAADRVVVAVVEGRVMVAAGANKDSGSVPLAKPLSAGELLSLSALPSNSRALTASETSPVGWHEERLAVQSEPLSRVLLDVNRYAPRPIAVDDPSLGDLMITGTVLRSDINGWLDSLEQAFPVRVIREPERIVIRSR